MALPDYLCPLAPEWRPLRDRLRVEGSELVQYTDAAARKEAARFRHPVADYQFGLHKILGIYDGVVHASIPFVTRCSAERLAELAKRPPTPEESGAAFALNAVKGNPLFFIFGAPAAIVATGLGVWQTKQDTKYKRELAARVHTLADEPLMWNRTR